MIEAQGEGSLMTDGSTRTTQPNRRSMLFGGSALVTAAALMPGARAQGANQGQSTASSTGDGRKPNILVIFGDDIGQSNLSAYTFGLMGYRTPNIDRIAREGMMFTDYYAEQSCTAGRSSSPTRRRCAPGYRRWASQAQL